MRKLLLVAVAMVCITTSAWAQQGLGYGVKGGLNVASMTNATPEYGAKLGFVMGAFADYGFTDVWGVSADVLFSTQGIRASETMDGDRLVKASRASYLNIPILANYTVLPGLNVKAGIQPGFVLSAKMVEKYKDMTIKEKAGDQIKTADFSIPVGASYELPSGVIFDLRYNFGVSNISKSDEVAHSVNNVLQLTVGFRL